jgi:hypothetical protein
MHQFEIKDLEPIFPNFIFLDFKINFLFEALLIQLLKTKLSSKKRRNVPFTKKFFGKIESCLKLCGNICAVNYQVNPGFGQIFYHYCNLMFLYFTHVVFKFRLNV